MRVAKGLAGLETTRASAERPRSSAAPRSACPGARRATSGPLRKSRPGRDRGIARAGPGPVLWAVDQVRANRVLLDVATGHVVVVSVLHGHPSVASLIDGALAGLPTRPSPPLCVDAGDPPHEPAQLVVALGPDEQMPVVRHHAVLEQPYRTRWSPPRQAPEGTSRSRQGSSNSVSCLALRFMTWKTNPPHPATRRRGMRGPLSQRRARGQTPEFLK